MDVFHYHMSTAQPANVSPYPTPAQLQDTLTQWAASKPALVRLETIGHSHQGRPILAVRLAAGPSERRILFVGGIHGLERVGVAMVLHLLGTLLRGYGGDPRITSLLGRVEVWGVPLANPDGYAAGRRPNARGVDLNRNFGVGFATSPLATWRRWPFYGGPSPYSEPESQALKAFAERQRFAIALSFHSFGGLINYPYGHTRRPPPDAPLLRAIAQEMRRRQPYERYAVRPLSWLYCPRGCLEDDLYESDGTLAFLLEMMPYFPRLLRPAMLWHRAAWFNAEAGELAHHLGNNLEPALYLIELAADP